MLETQLNISFKGFADQKRGNNSVHYSTVKTHKTVITITRLHLRNSISLIVSDEKLIIPLLDGTEQKKEE